MYLFEFDVSQFFQGCIVLFILAACILLFMRTPLYRRACSLSDPLFQSKASRIIWIPSFGSISHSWLARAVEPSWRHHNPTWRIEHIVESSVWTYFASDRRIFLDTYPVYASMDSPEERLDFIKMHILARYGGVWVDPLLLCLRPLDVWIEPLIAPTGLFMYRYQKDVLFHQHAVGFLAALPESYMIQSWKQAVYNYVNDSQRIRDPHWCMSLFEHLLHTDDRFLSEWNQTPSRWADAEGEAGIFVRRCEREPEAETNAVAVRMLLDKQPTLSRLFRLHPPPLVQLPKSMARWPRRILKHMDREALLQTLLHSFRPNKS